MPSKAVDLEQMLDENAELTELFVNFTKKVGG